MLNMNRTRTTKEPTQQKKTTAIIKNTPIVKNLLKTCILYKNIILGTFDLQCKQKNSP